MNKNSIKNPDLTNKDVDPMKNHIYKDRTNGVTSFKIDSLRMEFPLSEVELHSDFTDEYIVYNLTQESEVAEFDKKRMKKNTIKGVEYYTFINKRFKHKYFVVLLNAKMLHRRYFKGITTFTVRELYDNLMEVGHFYVSFESFLKCYCYDIDYCIDLDLRPSLVKSMFSLSYYTDKVKAQYLRKIINIFTGEVIRGNFFTGVQFGHRKEGSAKTPYCKSYNKELELFSPKRSDKMFSFYDRNGIKYDDLTNVWRFEFTIKSKKMIDSLLNTTGVKKTNTLEDLIDLASEELFIQSVKKQIAKAYRIGRYEEAKAKKEKKGANKHNAGIYGMQMFIDTNMRSGLFDTISDMKEFYFKRMEVNGTHRNTISKEKKLFTQLIADYLNGQNITPRVLKKIQKANVPLEEIYKLDEWFFALKFHEKI